MHPRDAILLLACAIIAATSLYFTSDVSLRLSLRIQQSSSDIHGGKLTGDNVLYVQWCMECFFTCDRPLPVVTDVDDDGTTGTSKNLIWLMTEEIIFVTEDPAVKIATMSTSGTDPIVKVKFNSCSMHQLQARHKQLSCRNSGSLEEEGLLHWQVVILRKRYLDYRENKCAMDLWHQHHNAMIGYCSSNKRLGCAMLRSPTEAHVAKHSTWRNDWRGLFIFLWFILSCLL